jgi:16S rRNA C1402 (ribose-2'-O) methylase RsmI
MRDPGIADPAYYLLQRFCARDPYRPYSWSHRCLAALAVSGCLRTALSLKGFTSEKRAAAPAAGNLAGEPRVVLYESPIGVRLLRNSSRILGQNVPWWWRELTKRF